MKDFISRLLNNHDLFLFVLVALCIIAILLIQLKKEKRLRDWVKWSASRHPLSKDLSCFESRIFDNILQVQFELDVPKEYRVTEEDTESANIIILACQHRLVYRYFSQHDEMILKKIKHCDEGKLLFYAELYSMLKENECESTFAGESMVGEYVSSDKGPYSRESTYKLSPFGLVFFKVYYLSYLYLKNHPDGKQYIGYETSSSFTEILDKKQRTVLRMRL